MHLQNLHISTPETKTAYSDAVMQEGLGIFVNPQVNTQESLSVSPAPRNLKFDLFNYGPPNFDVLS